MSFTPANIAALVIAASFAAGLNIYATVLTLGLLARTQWVALPPGLDSLGHTWVLVVCGVMFAMEFVADKIPGFDMIWNGLHTVVRVPVAALVAYHASSQLSPQMQVFATALGAAVALAAHSSKTARAGCGDAKSGADFEYCAEYDGGCVCGGADVVCDASSDDCGGDCADLSGGGGAGGAGVAAGDSAASAEAVWDGCGAGEG